MVCISNPCHAIRGVILESQRKSPNRVSQPLDIEVMRIRVLKYVYTWLTCGMHVKATRGPMETQPQPPSDWHPPYLVPSNYPKAATETKGSKFSEHAQDSVPSVGCGCAAYHVAEGTTSGGYLRANSLACRLTQLRASGHNVTLLPFDVWVLVFFY